MDAGGIIWNHNSQGSMKSPLGTLFQISGDMLESARDHDPTRVEFRKG